MDRDNIFNIVIKELRDICGTVEVVFTEEMELLNDYVDEFEMDDLAMRLESRLQKAIPIHDSIQWTTVKSIVDSLMN